MQTANADRVQIEAYLARRITTALSPVEKVHLPTPSPQVEILGVEVLDLLPPVFATRARFSPVLLPELLKLCNQLLAKFKVRTRRSHASTDRHRSISTQQTYTGPCAGTDSPSQF